MRINTGSFLAYYYHCDDTFLIRRPFGEEPEYFVQLFVDYDESLKLPTVGDLMKKMFREQDITFTQVQWWNYLHKHILRCNNKLIFSGTIKAADPSAKIWKTIQNI